MWHPTNNRLIILLILLLWASGATSQSGQLPDVAQTSHVVVIHATDKRFLSNDRVTNHLGFVVSPNHVLTANTVVGEADDLSVSVPDRQTQLAAFVTAVDESNDLVVLRVGAHGIPVPKLSVASLRSGRKVFSFYIADGAVQARAGTLNSEAGNAHDRIQHSVAINASGYGAPLVDECGRVVGINVLSSSVGTDEIHQHAPVGPEIIATSTNEFSRFLSNSGLEPQTVTEPCVNPAQAAARREEQALQREQEAARQAEQARQSAEAARQRADEAQRLAERLQREAEELQSASEAERERAEAAAAEARARAEESEQTARQAAEELASAQTALERVQTAARERESMLRRLIWIAIASGSFLLLLTGVAGSYVSRKRAHRASVAEESANQARAEAEAARVEAAEAAGPPPFHDCLLESEDRAIKLPGAKIPYGAGGVTLGRDPAQADVVINTEELSRAHARVFSVDDSVFITDLGSTNGTLVDGRQAEPGATMQLTSGSEVTLGTLSFRFRVID